MIRIKAKDWKAAGCPTKLRDVIDLGLHSGKETTRRVQKAAKRDRTAKNISFASKVELARWRELMVMQQFGDILYVHRQPIFDLEGIEYKADFLIVWPNGMLTYEDVKHHNWDRRTDPLSTAAARAFKQHREQVRQIYGVEIVVVER